MRWLAWFALRDLRARRGRTLLSLLALALSVGLVVATGSIGALMAASVARPAPLLGRPADFWISSAFDVDYDLPAHLAVQVKAVPGVAEVQPLLRRPVRVHTPRPDTLTLLGIEPDAYFDFHDLTLAAGELPSAGAPGLVALAPWAFVRELSLGQPVTVTTPSGDVPLPVVGLLEVENLTAAQQGLVLYAPLETVAGWFGLQDAVTALEVRLAPGASPRRVRDELEGTLGPAYAVSTVSRPGQGAVLWQRLVLGALAFVDILTLAGSAALVYAVFAAAARARQRQISLLRAAGAVRRQVLMLLLTEAAIVGVIGSGLGLGVGLGMAWVGSVVVLRDVDGLAVPPVPPDSLLLAVGLGVLVALAGAIGPAIRASQRPPLAALRAPHSPPSASTGGDCLWLVLLPVAKLFPSTVRLAAGNLARERRRSTMMVGAMALILAMVLGNVGVLSMLGGELAVTFAHLTGGDYLVLPGLTTISLRELAGQDTSDLPPLAPGLLAALEDLGDQVWLMGGTTAGIEALQVFPGQPTLLLDVEGYAQMGGFRFHAGDWPGALESFRQGPAVLLMPVVARRLNVSLGDHVQLNTLRGPVDFRVAGIGESEFTTCVLDLADGAAYLGANEVNGVEIQIRPGADAEAVRRALLDAVHVHGGTLLSLAQASVQLRELFHQVRLSIVLLLGITGLVAGLGVVNAMLASVTERRREIGLLRAVGMRRLQVRRLILVEMALLGAVAALTGTALGWGVTFLFVGLGRSYLGLASAGAPTLAAWSPLIAASLVGMVLWPLLAMLGGLIPAQHAARLPVIQALYYTTPG
jgi:putative ABC transport system permease protein